LLVETSYLRYLPTGIENQETPKVNLHRKSLNILIGNISVAYPFLTQDLSDLGLIE